MKSEGEGICNTCGEPTTFKGLTKGYYTFCNTKCMATNNSIKEKRKISMILAHGVDNPSKSDIFQEKKKLTWINKYGVDNPSKSPIIKQKIEDTNLKKYGTKSSLQNTKVKEKIKTTCNERYGTDRYQESDEFKEKIKITCNKRYGVDNVFQLDSVKEKSKETSRKKYGVDFPMQSECIREKIKSTNLLRFGVDNFSKTDEAKEIFRNNFINRIEEQKLNGEPLSPRVGNIERICIKELQKYTSYQIQKQKKFFGYFPDGYIHELNIIIEFYEKWHNNNCYIERDIYREMYLTKKLNCRFFIIKEQDWESDKHIIIKKFKEMITCL